MTHKANKLTRISRFAAYFVVVFAAAFLTAQAVLADEAPVANADSFTYVASDGEFDSEEATADITIISTNDSPIGTDKTIAIDEDAPYVFTINDFGFQDVDEGDVLSKIRIETLSERGDITIDGTYGLEAGAEVDVETINGGHLVYVPYQDQSGVGYASFTFSVFDSSGDEPSSISLVPNTITFDVNSVNDAPSVVDDESYTADQGAEFIVGADGGVLVNDSDIEGDSLTAVLVTDPSHGTVALNDDGGFDYIPENNYEGSDSFTYEAYDGGVYSAPATVYINVVDAAPYVTKAEAVSSTEVRITFNELLQNNDLYAPHEGDFKIYRSDNEGAEEMLVTGIYYSNKVINVYLSEPIVDGDRPMYNVLPDSGDIRDHSGNILSETLSGLITDKIAPVVLFTTDTSTVNVGSVINFFAGGSSDLWSGIKNYVWTFGDGTTYTTVIPTMSHPYSSAGTYNAVVTVYDNNDNMADAEVSIVVIDNSSSIGTASGGGGGGSSASSQPTNSLSGNSASTTTTYSASTTTPKVAGQVLGEKISRIDELIKLTKYGERSDNVRELQLELKNAGFFPKYQIATGYFGPITLTSVKKYLASQNRLSELRNSKIDELIALTKYGERSDSVKSLQIELKNAGFFPKYQIATGYFGPITLASVKKYQAYITL